jgi:hypothetical protein
MKGSNAIGDELRSEDEAARRRDAALLRALSTPHKRQAEMKVGKAKPESGAKARQRKPQVTTKARV